MRSTILRWCAFLAAAVFSAVLSGSPAALARNDAGPATARQSIPDVAAADLPQEARETLKLIRQGGPFPYERDGAVFGNFEKLLPQRERGYYREYTVKTPGAGNRGARRLVAGKNGELYYTDDHYQSFRRIRE